MTWCDFIELLRSSEGVAAAVGVALSFVLEWWPAFGELPARQKRVAVLAICVAIPALATASGYFSGCLPALDRDALWMAVYIGAITFGASQFAHLRELDDGEA